MSASREKKQRRTTDAPLSTSRAQEEQAKAARRKRNTIVYTVIGVVAVILIAALLIWDSGVFQRNAAVAHIDGQKVTAPQVLYHYQNNSENQMILYYAQIYAQSGMEFPYSTSESPRNQVITEEAVETLGVVDESYVGKTFHDYFLDNAMDDLRREYALTSAAKAAGYTLSDAGKASVENEMASLDSGRESYMLNYGVNMSRKTYLQQIYGKQMTESAYRSCLENAYLASEYYTEGFDALTDYSDGELDAYYQEHQDELDTISYYQQEFKAEVETGKDEDGNPVQPTEEETAAALAKAKEAAEDALKKVKASPNAVKDNEDFDDLTRLVSNVSSGSVYYDWLMDSGRKAGDAEIFENGSSGYYLVVFEGRYLDQTPTADVRHILVSAMAEDDPATEDVDESTQDPSDEAFETAKAEAERILAEWQAGGATEESFAALANQYSADPGSNTNGGLYEKVAQGRMIESFNDWVFASGRKSGDFTAEPVQNTQSQIQGWHLIYYVGENEPVWKTTVRGLLWTEELKSTVQVERTAKLDSLF